jgi:hypothetical protein
MQRRTMVLVMYRFPKVSDIWIMVSRALRYDCVVRCGALRQTIPAARLFRSKLYRFCTIQAEVSCGGITCIFIGTGRVVTVGRSFEPPFVTNASSFLTGTGRYSDTAEQRAHNAGVGTTVLFTNNWVGTTVLLASKEATG